MLSQKELKAGWREYDVTRACGHAETVKVFAVDHQGAIDAAASVKCSKCDPLSGTTIQEVGGEKHAR